MIIYFLALSGQFPQKLSKFNGSFQLRLELSNFILSNFRWELTKLKLWIFSFFPTAFSDYMYADEIFLLIVWKPLERPFTKEEYFVSGMRWKWGIISNSNMDRILGLVSFICFKFFVDHFYMRPIRTSTYMDTIIRWLSIWELIVYNIISANKTTVIGVKYWKV